MEFEDYCKVLEEEIDTVMEEIFFLTDDVIKEKLSDSKEMIGIYLKQTSDIESRRNNLANTNLTRLAASIALFGFLVKFDLPQSSIIALLLGLGVIVVLSLNFFHIYIKQSQFRYPWSGQDTDHANQWKWFYYGNKYINEISFTPEAENKNKDWEAYLRGLKFFLSRSCGETSREALQSSLYQQYLLQVHNGYKNKFYLQLANLENTTLVSSVFVGMLVIVVFFCSIL